MQRWFRNHANRGTQPEDIKYIPHKHLKAPAKVIPKPPKPIKASTVDKAVIKALDGTSRKFTMPLREAYTEIHKDELLVDMKKAWEQEKRTIIATDDNCKGLTGSERNTYLN